jgi:tRNA threonylcarbamoyladenosine biosynthesis protein TsaB
MAFILNIETATPVCSVCISENDRVIVLKEITGNDHAAKITLLIEACLSEAALALSSINAVAISNGPGSYTSLRIGTSTAKGLCYALNIPLISISTLEALAFAAFQQYKHESVLYCPMIDARRMEVYQTLFRADTATGMMHPLSTAAPMIVDNTAFSTYLSTGQQIVFIGDGSPKCRAILTQAEAIFLPVFCSAGFLPPLSYRAFLSGNFADLAYHTPDYLKAPNITTPKKRL